MAYHIDAEGPYIISTFTGVYSDEMLMAFQDDNFSAPGFETKDQLVDYSGVTEYLVTVQGQERYTNLAQQRYLTLNVRPDRQIALYVPTDMEYAMARIFLTQIESLPVNFQLFRTLDAAKRWLGDSGSDGLSIRDKA